MGLNDQQKRVFDAPITRNVAVSAGAGTGKSRTLKTKVLDLITDKGIKPSEFLIVTFTNEATNSLRNDIKKEIRKNNLTHLYSEVDSMHIDTLDAFRLFIVKKYSHVLGLNGNISILDDSINKLEKLKIYEKLINELYENEDSLLKEYIEDFLSKKDIDMQKIILLASDSIDVNKYNKQEFIDSYYEQYLSYDVVKSKLDDYLKNYYKDIPDLVGRMIQIIDNIPEIEKKGQIVENSNKTLLENMYSELRHASNVYEIIEGLKYLKENKGSFKHSDQFDDYDECKEINEKIKSYVCFDIKSALEIDLKYSQKYIPLFLSIAYDLKVELEQFKKTYSLYTYSDISKLALKVLEDKSSLNEIKNSFKVIMIDEYQDNSDIDDEFFTKIANNNLLVVGDVKQSIYGFKGANPEKFNNKFNEISKENLAIDKTKPYTMNVNYRSRREVLEAVNSIFENYMSISRGGVDYKKDNHSLVYESNLLFDNIPDPSIEDKGIKYLMSLSDDDLISLYNKATGDNKLANYIKGPNDKNTKYILTCALSIASRINQHVQVGRKIESKDPVSGEKNTKYIVDDIKFSDFGVLTRNGINVNKCREIFSHLGIPANFVVDEEITSSVMVEVILSIIKCINIIIKSDDTDLEFENENEFKLNFVSILRSFLFKKTDKDIYDLVANNYDSNSKKIIQNLSYRNSPIYEQIVTFAKNHSTDSLANLFMAIFNEFNFIDNLDKVGNAIEYIQKYTLLLEKIKGMDSIGYQIEDLIFFFENIDKLGLKIEVRLGSDTLDAVTVETIHKSKGLEFPIVYVECDKKFKTSTNALARGGENTSYYGNNLFGYYLPRKTSDKNDSSKTYFINDYASLKLKEKTLSEETRLFYVALTRAKEVCVCVYNEPLEAIPEKEECTTYQEIVASSGYEMAKDAYDLSDKKVTHSIETLAPEKVEIKEKQIKFKEKEVVTSHPSIELSDDVNEDLLKAGTRYHEYMELVNLKTKDTSFIVDKKDRAIADKVLTNKIFDNLPDDSHIFKEYKYLDESGVTGIIDLLLVYEDHCVIIDYKLKNADEEKYTSQLNAYKTYIENVFKLDTECYLIPIFGN